MRLRARKLLIGEGWVGAVRLGDAALRLLPRLGSAEGGQVKERVGTAELVGAAGERRVRVEDAVAVAQEAAQARHLSRDSFIAGRLGPVVIDGRLHRRVDCRVKVVVEVAAVGGVPAEVPAAGRLVGSELV